MIVFAIRPPPWGNRFIGAGLAAMWLWTGIVYHWVYFTTINKAAFLFGALFVIQGALLLHAAFVRGDLVFGARRDLVSWIGWALVAYAAGLYPLVGMWTGHAYPEMPMFGITPCPVTIFTFGMLLLTGARVARRLLALPLAWSLVGGSAAFLLGVAQDWPLLVSGLAIVLLVLRDRGVLARGAAA